MYKKGNFFLLNLLICTCLVKAQKAVTSGGANSVSISGNMSFVVGQVNYTNTGNDATFSKGILQLYYRPAITYVFSTDNTNNIQVWLYRVRSNLITLLYNNTNNEQKKII